MAIKISLGINELEKLLGGNEELQLEIRQSAAAEFAKRYLKDIANSETMRQAVAAINRSIEASIKTQIGELVTKSNGGWGHQYVFSPSPQFKEQIDKYFSELIVKNINDQYQRCYEEVTKAARDHQEYWKIEIAQRIDKQIEKEIAAQVKAEVERRIQAALNR